ncbi:hypothetical protein GSI_09486 [Ganoderma sinense ZZ0214-1]|uniref:F-box domain-containing protein n=1 Tax=Ganoderma sinense ZZ0214-1 TaxID=1077348 RepID=A0A2G8S3M2_9APHY|nr:hypothetical protein GSI_09486 [Ganoderma sinense ZZ0214-1]
MAAGTRYWIPLEYAQNPFVCGVIGGPSLGQALRHMPTLRSISVLTRERAVHGLSWTTVKTILSLPQIQEVSITGLLLCPSKLPHDDYRLDSWAPLTSFHYEVFSNRIDGMKTRQNYPFPSEEEVLLLVLSRIHTSLEKLVLSTEPAPLLAMSQWTWPRLRELRLRGERRSLPPVPYMTLLSAMPNLRTLILEFTLVSEECTHAGPLWPPGSHMPFPWPDLTHLSVANPNPSDELYRYLPPSVRVLSLCCRPHKSEKAWISTLLIYTVHVYEYPVLTSAEMLGILENCHLPHLTRLEIEYEVREREGELDLLRRLGSMFPQLTWLQIHRYRAATPSGGPGDIPPLASQMQAGAGLASAGELDFIDDIAQALSHLPRLHTICAHLDLPQQPKIQDNYPFYYNRAKIDEYTKTLRDVTHCLARTIPSLETLYFWRPRRTGHIEWAPFEVVRADGAAKDDFEIRCPEDVRTYGGPQYPVIPMPDLYGVDP